MAFSHITLVLSLFISIIQDRTGRDRDRTAQDRREDRDRTAQDRTLLSDHVALL
jgi:hypothetical protein